jgi:hypothetical protein
VLRTYQPGSICDLEAHVSTCRAVVRPYRNSRIVFLLLVVHPSRTHYTSASAPSSHQIHTNSVTHTAAPPPSSRRTCCRTCRCRSAFLPWYHLRTRVNGSSTASSLEQKRIPIYCYSEDSVVSLFVRMCGACGSCSYLHLVAILLQCAVSCCVSQV